MKKNKFGNISFTTENIEEFIKQYKNQDQLLPLYIDKIRNGHEFTDEMLENIANFDSISKMKLICEYNRCMKIYRETIR